MSLLIITTPRGFADLLEGLADTENLAWHEYEIKVSIDRSDNTVKLIKVEKDGQPVDLQSIPADQQMRMREFAEDQLERGLYQPPEYLP